MAAFTSLALLGLGLAGGMAASKLKKKPGEAAPVTAPAPIAAAPTAPTPPVLDPSGDVLAARQAGIRQRRRGGGNTGVLSPRKGSVLGRAPQAGAAVMPRSLIGSGY